MPAALSFAEFERQVRGGVVAPVYLFEGEEAWFHDEGARRLEAAVLSEGTRATDRDALRGAETTLAAVLDRADTFAMGGGRRLILVRAADGLRVEDPGPLKAYLARPNPRSIGAASCTGPSNAPPPASTAVPRTKARWRGSSASGCATAVTPCRPTWRRRSRRAWRGPVWRASRPSWPS
jgi:hypothetical protein